MEIRESELAAWSTVSRTQRHPGGRTTRSGFRPACWAGFASLVRPCGLANPVASSSSREQCSSVQRWRACRGSNNAKSHLDAVTTVSQRALQDANPPGRYVVCASEASAVYTHYHCLPPLAVHPIWREALGAPCGSSSLHPARTETPSRAFEPPPSLIEISPSNDPGALERTPLVCSCRPG